MPRPNRTSSRTVACWRQLPVPVFRVCGLPSGTQCCTPLLQPLYPPSYILQLLLYCVWLGQADAACEAHSTTMCVRGCAPIAHSHYYVTGRSTQAYLLSLYICAVIPPLVPKLVLHIHTYVCTNAHICMPFGIKSTASNHQLRLPLMVFYVHTYNIN